MGTAELIMTVVILVLCAVCAVLAASAAKNAREARSLGAQTKQDVGDGFSRLRTETAQAQSSLRGEVNESLARQSASIDAMTRAAADDRQKLSDTLTSFIRESRDSERAAAQKSSEQAERLTRMVSDSVSAMQESNEKKLEQMRATVDEKLTETLGKRLDSSFETVSKQLSELYTSLGEMKELSGGVTGSVTALNRVLTNVKSRGTWAEVQLGSILDQIIPGCYERNYRPANGAGVVEFAIRIPTGDGSTIYMPVDSKFPAEDYRRVCDAADAADPAALAEARKALMRRVTDEGRTVAKYIDVPHTTPFAVMYLATEGLYAEVMSSDSGTAERLQRDCGVLITGPATVVALLNSLALGFRTVAINEKADQVMDILSGVKKEYDTFCELLEKTGKKISDAGEMIDKAQKRSGMIRKKLRSVSEAGTIGEADRLLGLDADDGPGEAPDDVPADDQ